MNYAGENQHKAGLRLWPLAVLGLALLSTACSNNTTIPTVEEMVASTRESLLDEGIEPDVTDCVLELAERRFRSGPLGDLAREELVTSCRAAQEVLSGVAAGPGSAEDAGDLAFTGPNTYGDDRELDLLWDRCEDGDGAACDELFERSPVGSGYEAFGVSCGDREQVMDCVELLEEQPAPVPTGDG